MRTSPLFLGIPITISFFYAAGCGLVLDAPPPEDAAVADSGNGGLDAGPIALDAGTDAGALLDDAGPPDAPPDAPSDGGQDGGPVECVTSADCDALGPPPCGAWQCNAGNTCDVVCAMCTDGDLDGYGVGSGCAGGDCDDADDLVGATSSAPCYPGSPTTSGVGACVGGTMDCNDGTWSACLGAIVPSAESCNAVDDDCDGATDELPGTTACGLGACAASAPVCAGGAIGVCTPLAAITTTDGCNGVDDDCDGRVDDDCTSCVWVGPGGNDTALDPRVVATPFRTIQAAIDWAAADATRPQRVCLLSAGCSAANAIFNGAVTMANGVSVQGNYAPGGASRCGGATSRTEIRTGTASGVLFPATVTSATTLADVQVTPFAPATDSAGITVDGASGVVVRGVYVPPSSGVVTNGWGIDVRGGGDATITRSIVYGGRGSAESIGIRAVGSRVDVLDNCPGYDGAGRCNMECGYLSTLEGVRGRNDTTGTRSMVSQAILLRDSPGSTVARTSTCGAVSTNSAAVRIEGDAAGTVVTRSYIAGWGGEASSWGVDMAPCAGASPWIVDNFEIHAEGGASTPQGGVRAVGDCHPVIQRNVRIMAGLEGRGLTHGVWCGADRASGIASRCVIEDNSEIRGAAGGFPAQSTGVRCEGGGCARIVRNVITGFQGAELTGLVLEGSSAFVDRNAITGGCGTMRVVGVLAQDSTARIQNDVIVAGACSAGATGGATRWVAMMVRGTRAGSGLDVRSCDLDPRVTAGPAGCTSAGLEIDATGAVPLGTYRGNIVMAGGCATSYPVLELDADADPFAFESNDLVRTGTRAVYRDEGTTDLTTAAAVDALIDARVGSNLDLAPMFVTYPTDLHLSGTSPLRDMDMAAGYPLYDFDGRTRVLPPDIGAFEH